MKIGVISDLHGKCPKNIFAALSGVSLILSLGDIENEDIITDLGAVATVISVRGNCDTGFDISKYPAERELEILGLKIYMCHVLGVAANRSADIVLYGHTHVAENEIRGGVLYFNPGSASRPRKGNASVGIIEISENKIMEREIIEI